MMHSEISKNTILPQSYLDCNKEKQEALTKQRCCFFSFFQKIIIIKKKNLALPWSRRSCSFCALLGARCYVHPTACTQQEQTSAKREQKKSKNQILKHRKVTAPVMISILIKLIGIIILAIIVQSRCVAESPLHSTDFIRKVFSHLSFIN